MARWDHIAYQTERWDYYIPALFNHSATFEKRVPCCVGDINRGFEKWEKEIQRYYPDGSTFWLLGNHPVQKLIVQGCVVSWKWKFIGEIDHAIFKIDDCTREKADTASLLHCKCSKSRILQYGLPNADLRGWQLRLHGTMNSYRELEVESIEICTSVLQEVEFWRMTMQWREILAEPWVFKDEALDQALANNEVLASNNSYNFVQWLASEAFKNELQISGEDRPCGATHELLLPTPVDFGSVNTVLFEDVNLSGNEAEIVNASPVVARHSEHSEADPGTIVELVPVSKQFSLSDYRRLLTEYLICQRKREISMLNTFRNPTLMQVLRSTLKRQSQRQTQQQEEEEASHIFAQAVARLVDMGIVRVFAQGRILNLQMLQLCYSQASARIDVLIAMRLKTGVLDLEALCEVVKLPYQKPLNGILLDLYKRALRCATESPESQIRSWWMEMVSVSVAVVHFIWST
ncbi:LAFA_0C04984g1_1 [Lachancea sp. 'fantastica']|nr:LAFA_0C04984g1_1 [Lachancea sp. 'fantastica']